MTGSPMEKPFDPQVTAGKEPPKKRWGRARYRCANGFGNGRHCVVFLQSAAWTRQSNRLMNEYNALERRAGILTLQGMQSATIHTAMFMQVLAAQEAGNEKLANFYVERFPLDVRKAYDAWLAQKPFANPKADPHPFVPNLYEPRGTREAAELSAKAANNLLEARRAGNTSGQYLANTVLFATMLFFANAVNEVRAETRARRRVCLCCGSVRVFRCADGVTAKMTTFWARPTADTNRPTSGPGRRRINRTILRENLRCALRRSKLLPPREARHATFLPLRP